MEIWDVYEKDGKKVPGMSVVRGNPVPEGLCHLVCDVLVRHTDGTYLIMQRDPRKRHALMWEASAGGSAVAGETALDCALRELFEETGIKAETLTYLGTETSDITRAIYCEYLCETDCGKNSIVLQDGETVGFRWITKSELLSMPETELITTRMQKFLA